MHHPTAMRLLVLLLAVLFPLLTGGCGGGDKPRTLDEIFKEERELPKLYLTAITLKRVIAPGSRSIFSDKETGEVCWPALECQNPDCPGKAVDGTKFLFISPDLPFVAKPDGTAASGPPDPRTVPGTSTLCPQCLKFRNRNTEKPELSQKYVNWVRHYELPESARRKTDLAKERQKRHEFEQRAE